MTAGFSLKKIKSEMTLGAKLKKARTRRKVSLEQAEIDTKIRGKFIVALENDNWRELPADAYTKGFVMRYAKYLGLPADAIFTQYKREKDIRFSADRDNILPVKSVKEVKFIITPRLMIPVLIGMFIITVFGYIVYQVYGFAAAPELQVMSPSDNAIFDQDTIEITGITDQNARVFVNKDQIQVSADGKFVADYKLQKGVNVIEVKSQGKTDKEKALTYTVEYKPKTAAVDSAEVAN